MRKLAWRRDRIMEKTQALAAFGPYSKAARGVKTNSRIDCLKKNKSGKMKSVSHVERPYVYEACLWSESFFTRKWPTAQSGAIKRSFPSGIPAPGLAAKVLYWTPLTLENACVNLSWVMPLEECTPKTPS